MQQPNAEHPVLTDAMAGGPQRGQMMGGQFYADDEMQLAQQIDQAAARPPDPNAMEMQRMMRQMDPEGRRKAMEAFERILAAHYMQHPPRSMQMMDQQMEDPENTPMPQPGPQMPGRDAFQLTPLAAKGGKRGA